MILLSGVGVIKAKRVRIKIRHLEYIYKYIYYLLFEIASYFFFTDDVKTTTLKPTSTATTKNFDDDQMI